MRAHRLEWVDLLKIDIEGAEIELLEGLRQDVRANRTDDGRVSRLPASKRPTSRRQSGREDRDSGFYVVNFGRRHFTDVMCLNRAKFKVNLRLRVRLAAAKYARGARRIAACTFRGARSNVAADAAASK